MLVLNDYQQLMLRITTLTPYNAVHAALIDSERYNLTQLHLIITELLHHLGLGYPQFTDNISKVYFLPLDTPIEIALRSIALQSHIAAEMNTPFAIDDLPLRFFIIVDRSQYYFSITYNHWIADAFSIIQLMETIFLMAIGQSPAGTLTMDVPVTEHCFQPVFKNRIFYYRYRNLISKMIQCSRAYRTKISPIESTDSGCIFHTLTPNEVTAVLAFCKMQQMTFNDLLIAILAKTLGEITATQRNTIKRKFLKAKRDRILISVITNIRPASKIPLQQFFGLMLGFFSIALKSPETYPLTTLCQQVSAKTKVIKQRHQMIKEYLLFKIQNKWWDRCKTTRSQYRLFSKNVPITAGISNMNLTDNTGTQLFQHYIRCSPTAIVCPIVFSLTTLNQIMTLTICYRKACFTEEEAIDIKDRCLRQIGQLC